MAQNIEEKIQNLNNLIAWVKENKPERYETKYLDLVKERLKLKRVLYAEENNPGIAAFGKSQVGKSYFVSCLLQDNNGKPFMVGGKDFVLEINPPSDEGGGTESTGVVSRFTSFTRNKDVYSNEYPILVKLFPLADIVTILADSYYNDFQNSKEWSDEEVKNIVDDLYNTYSVMPDISAPVISADDILYMKDYFGNYIKLAKSINRSSFFDRLALVVEKIPPKEYITVFQKLWTNNINFTRLYSKLYNVLETFGFARYVYLPIESVLHNQVKSDTIMSVQCLKELFADSDFKTDVYVRENGQLVKKASGIPKSQICAVCAEVDFKIEEEFFESTKEYDFTYIGDDVEGLLPHEKFKMSMLKDTDLLDFPGAKTREKENIDKTSENAVLLNCFLRGKVAFLFNKYNDDKIINILLFSHHNKDSDVTELYQLLENWIKNYVGENFTERARKEQLTGGISPLFYIGTMFNLDLQVSGASQVTKAGFDDRWKRRFSEITDKQIFHTFTVDWVRNWTREGEHFHNCYMLRDYKFSGPKAGLYEGFADSSGKVVGQCETGKIISDEHFGWLRDTFVNNEFCKPFFKNPALSFDVAATMNNDGSLYLMQQLAKVAANISNARNVEFAEIIADVSKKVCDIMAEFYVSENVAEILDENIVKAFGIMSDMDTAKEHNSEYFGALIEGLQFSEPECYKKLHSIKSSLATVGNDSTADYEDIRKRCHNFEGCNTIADKWNALLKVYRNLPNINAAEKYLAKRGIVAEILFKDNVTKKKYSAIIAEKLYGEWVAKISGVEFQDRFGGDANAEGILCKMDRSTSLNNLVQCLTDSATTLKLTERIEQAIEPQTDIIKPDDINVSFVADIVATMISSFVLDFGFQYLSPEQVASAKSISERNELPAFHRMSEPIVESYDEDEITDLFNKILNGDEEPACNVSYNKWLEYMFVSFVANVKVPDDYNKEANDLLLSLLLTFGFKKKKQADN